jgi:hypothetical protein
MTLKNTLPIHLSYESDELPLKLNLLFFCNKPIWLTHQWSLQKIETIKAPQNRRFYFEV